MPVRRLLDRLQLTPCLAIGVTAIALLCALAVLVDKDAGRRHVEPAAMALRGSLAPGDLADRAVE